MKRTVWVLLAWAVLLGGTAARAATININNIMVTVDPPGQLMNIGSITATTADTGDANGDVTMSASFALNNPQNLMFCGAAHWVQVITQANSRAVAGGNPLEYPQGTAVTTGGQPVIDTPNGGYYFNNGTQYVRTPTGEDALPWYLTTAEENDGNHTVNGVPGAKMSDAPTVLGATFNTYLVATDPDDGPNVFMIIAGFTWKSGNDPTGGNAAALTQINVGQNDLNLLNGVAGNGTGALAFSGFGGYTAELASSDDLDLCPEPASMTLLLIGGGLAFGRQFVRRKRAA